MKLSIVVAVYNEGSSVSSTLQRVWDEPLRGVSKEVVIVESNSKDNSRELCIDFSERINLMWPGSVKLILQDRALGKGNAVRLGLQHATGDIVLIQDADSEYDPSDYGPLIAPIIEGKTNFVLGSRHLSAGTWKIRKFEAAPVKAALLNFGGRLFHTFFNLMFGTSLSDPTTMYKVFRRSCIEGVLFEADRFDFDFELLGKLIRLGHRPVEVPVSYVSRGFEEGKKINILRDPFTWIRAIVRFRFSPLRVEGTRHQPLEGVLYKSDYAPCARVANGI
jgi:glycosyltransferase involved in cell wall biosynthesis